MRFNAYLNTHFKGGGCRLLGNKLDPHRGREVQVYAMPGYTDVVGISDGTDSWVAPALVITAHFGEGLAEQVRRLQAGQDLLPPVMTSPKRSRVSLDEDDEPQPRSSTKRLPHRSTRVALEA